MMHRVVHGTEYRGHSAQACYLSVKHIEQGEEYYYTSRPGHEIVIHMFGRSCVAGIDEYHRCCYIAEKPDGGDHVRGDPHAYEKAYKRVDHAIDALLKSIAHLLEC